MEGETGRWVLGFLSAQKRNRNRSRSTMTMTMRVRDTLIKRMGLSVSESRFHYQKAALISILRRQLSTASITEEMLRNLEVFEELHCRFGYPLSPALPAAYCAVAVECTLKYLELEPSPSNNPAYISAVDRIWRGRYRKIERGSILLSEESKRWSRDIEASFKDPQVRERFGTMNSRRYAFQKLILLLDEAQNDLGPSFLEFVASMPIAPDTATATAQLQTVKDTYGEPPIENRSANTPIENQSTDAPIENCSKAAPIENQDKDAPTEFQSPCDPIENEGADVQLQEQPVCQTIHNDDLAKTTDACPSKVHHPSLMDRNKTARTDEWDKSTDNLQEEISNHACRVQLPSPKRRKMSPLKTYEPQKIVRRRKAKRWSALEEETLRAAVNKIGEGNWKSILDSHEDVFAERTQVDLKDKWRNLTRYGPK